VNLIANKSWAFTALVTESMARTQRSCSIRIRYLARTERDRPTGPGRQRTTRPFVVLVNRETMSVAWISDLASNLDGPMNPWMITESVVGIPAPYTRAKARRREITAAWNS